MSYELTPENRLRLKAVSSATLTTALLKRGLRNTCMQGVGLLNAEAETMVGEAFTLRYIPAREDIDVLSAFEDSAHPQRKAIEAVPAGHVLVMDGRRDARAATAGAILVTRAMVRGAAGIVSDGGMRDTPSISAMDFPVYAAGPSAPTNLIRHHAVDVNVPIGCGDVAVYPGDIIVGDAEGVVVIPAAIANEIAEEATAMTAFENWVEAQVRAGRSITGLYPPNAAASAEYAAFVGSRAAAGPNGGPGKER